MNLDTAIDAHAQWKTKLRTAIQKKEPIDAVGLAKDNQCELGKWLHGEAKVKYGTQAEWAELLKQHAAFHQAMGKVAGAISGGRYAEAEQLVAGPDFTQASKQVTLAIMRLKVTQ